MTISSPSTITDFKREDVDEGQMDHKHPINDPLIQVIIAACCAIIVSGVIFACVICIRKHKEAKRRKSTLGNFILTGEAPMPFGYASMGGQLFRSRSDDRETMEDRNYNTFTCTYSEEYPQEELTEIDQLSDRSSTPSSTEILDSSMTESPQSDKATTISKISAVKKLKMMRRAKSMGNISTGLASGVLFRADNETSLTFCLEYHELNCVLNIDLQNAMDIPARYQYSDVYVVANLFPKSNEGITSKEVPMDEVVHFDEILQFQNVSSKELEQSTLRLSLFSKKKTKSKPSFIGEAFVQCSEIDTKSETPTRMDVVLQRKRLKKHSTADKHLYKNLGEIFVLLQYNSMANRMKVFLRRAEHLPKSDRLLRQPVHYVILNVYREDELIMTKESKTQSGYSPVWNQPFLFDIPSRSVSECTLELVIMRGRLYSKDGVIGRVVIGRQGPKTGVDHWQEMIKPCAREVAKWHNIYPVFKFE